MTDRTWTSQLIADRIGLSVDAAFEFEAEGYKQDAAMLHEAIQTLSDHWRLLFGSEAITAALERNLAKKSPVIPRRVVVPDLAIVISIEASRGGRT